jgi:hypothetical protein
MAERKVVDETHYPSARGGEALEFTSFEDIETRFEQDWLRFRKGQ